MQPVRGRGSHYFEAAQERFQDANVLFKNRQYSGASYLCGCSIEATFWAFVPLTHARGIHDLYEIYRAGLGARFDALYREQFKMGATKDTLKFRRFEQREREINGKLNEARLRWDNSFRYFGDVELEAELKNKRSFAKSTMPILESSVRTLIDNAHYFLILGSDRKVWFT